MIKYTFIIPHKDSLELLKRCIDSIPERKDIEIIIVDDNSRLSKYDISHYPGLNRFNTRIIFNKENKGAGHARNIGIKEAQGQWLLFADADDFYNDGFVDVLDKSLEPQLDILYFNVGVNFNWNFSVIEKYKAYFDGVGDTDDIKYIWNPWNKVFSRKYIISNNFVFDEIPVGNDAMFCLKASYHSKNIKIIKDKLYVYTNDNKSSITLKKMSLGRKLNYLKINIRINKFFRSINKEKYASVLISPWIIYCIYKNYKLNGVIQYVSCLISKKVLFNELIFWIKNRNYK